MKNLFRFSVIAAGLLVPSIASANFFVSPTRINLTEKSGRMDVKIVNQDDKKTSYRIRTEKMEMQQDGSFKAAAGVNDIVIFSPKQVSLNAKGYQSVSFGINKAKVKAKGEYITHVFFEELPPDDLFNNTVEDQSAKKGKLVSTRAVPLLSISIPAIVRIGDEDVKASISNGKLVKHDSKTFLQFNVSNKGTTSPFGDIKATISEKGAEVVVASITKASVLKPLNDRAFEIEVNKDYQNSLNGKTVRVTYSKTQEDGGDVIATADFKM